MCLSMCDNTPIRHVLENSKCNLSCTSSIKIGEWCRICYFSMAKNDMLPDKHFGGILSNLLAAKWFQSHTTVYNTL